MTNCLHTKPDGTKQMFEYFFIHGVNVRYVKLSKQTPGFFIVDAAVKGTKLDIRIIFDIVVAS